MRLWIISAAFRRSALRCCAVRDDHDDRRFHLFGMVRVMLSRRFLGSLIAVAFLLAARSAFAATCSQTFVPLQYDATPGDIVNLAVVDDGTGSGHCRLSGDIGSIGGAPAALDACQMYPHVFTSVRLTAAGTSQVIAGTAGKNTYICQANFPNTSVDLALIEGTGTNCATIVRGMAGGTTAAAGWTLGVEVGDGDAAVMATTTAGDSVCVVSSAAASGSLVTVQE